MELETKELNMVASIVSYHEFVFTRKLVDKPYSVFEAMPSTFLKLGTKIKARTEINASKKTHDNHDWKAPSACKNRHSNRKTSTQIVNKQTTKTQLLHTQQQSIPRDALRTFQTVSRPPAAIVTIMQPTALVQRLQSI